jgi:hypothetical protein
MSSARAKLTMFGQNATEHHLVEPRSSYFTKLASLVAKRGKLHCVDLDILVSLILSITL